MQGPVKCLATSAPYLVSGGADDLIHLYDLQVRAIALQCRHVNNFDFHKICDCKDTGFCCEPRDGC